MKELIEMLKSKGIVDTLQRAVNVVPISQDISEEDAAEARKHAMKNALCHVIASNDEIGSKFVEVAYNLGMDALIKELDIKRDPNYEITTKDKFNLLMAELKFGDIFNK